MTGYDFDQDGPFLLLDTIFEPIINRKKFHLRDKFFTIESTTDTFCIGSYDLDTQDFLICPHKAQPQNGKTLCSYCQKQNGFNPAFYNASSVSPKQERYNQRPHVVYLANFGQNLTKVGIASRVPTRWLEQGARSVLVIKNCANAYEARRIEEKTRKDLAIPEAINNSLKRRIILSEYNKFKAEKELLNIRDQLINVGIDAEENSVLFLDDYYLGGNKIAPNVIDLTKDSDVISGKFIGLIGDILLVSQGSENFVMSLKKNISHVIKISPRIIPLKINAQPTLGI